jgi:DNA-binding MarR family transcriptional regulator
MNAQLTRHLHRQLQDHSDLSGPDYEVLVHLSESDEGRLRPFELGRALQWEKSRLSHHLTRMERRGQVAREECETDARGAEVAITTRGRDAIVEAAPAHVAEIRRVFVDALGPRRLEELAGIAAVVLARLEASADDDPSHHERWGNS